VVRTSAAEVIVVGAAGTMGSAALWQLAVRGVDVLGVDRFEPGHDRGSGHGESRIIRTAYFEHPSYVPLVRSSWRLWRELEAGTGASVLTRTGALMVGAPDGVLIKGALAAAAEHRLSHAVLDPAECAARFPQHPLEPGEIGVLEPDAGVLRPEAGIRAMAAAAVAAGARLVTGQVVDGLRTDEHGASVQVGGQTFAARQVVVCAGPWTPTLLPELAPTLQVERQVPMWFAADDPPAYGPDRFPVFVRQLHGGFLYGCPALDGHTVKVGLHHGGTITTADAVDRTVRSADIAALTAVVRRVLPGLRPEPVRGTVCLYTNSPDDHFVVGALPDRPNLTFISACSGHGYKFAPVLGQVAAQLALAGRTEHSIALFDPARLFEPDRPFQPVRRIG
jgi:sarcosine oxidase